MGHKTKVINFIINSITTLIVIILIFIITILVVIAINTNKNTMEIGNFRGYKPIICISNSMKNEFQVGDIVISKKVNENEITIGDIVTFRENGTIITHRVEQINYNINGQKQYITKGDSNNAIDEFIITYEDIEGKYYYKIPKIGNLILMLQKPQGYFVVFVIPISILAIWYKLMLTRKKIKDSRKSKLLKRLQQKGIINNTL